MKLFAWIRKCYGSGKEALCRADWSRSLNPIPEVPGESVEVTFLPTKLIAWPLELHLATDNESPRQTSESPRGGPMALQSPSLNRRVFHYRSIFVLVPPASFSPSGSQSQLDGPSVLARTWLKLIQNNLVLRCLIHTRRVVPNLKSGSCPRPPLPQNGVNKTPPNYNRRYVPRFDRGSTACSGQPAGRSR